MHRLEALGVSLMCFLAIAIGPGVRFAGQEQPPRFRAGVKVIQIDATVLDKNGKPVRGLTLEDFSVLENGRPQPLVGFTEVVLPDTAEPMTPWLRDVAPDVVDNQTPDGRLLVLVMDDAMLPPDAAMLRVSKEIARGAVERMGPADRMAVVFTRDNRNAQDFTADRARLLRAIERTSIGFIFTDGPSNHFYEASVATLRLVAQALQKVPHRRKAIIYVSIGVPSRSDRVGMLSSATGLGAMDGLLDRIRDVLGDALSSTTAIYSFDPSGIGGLESFAASRPKTRVGDPERFRQFLREVADNTGGRATLQTNDYGPGLTRMFEETASYYLLGYESTAPPDDGAFRRVEVKTSRPGTTVRARTGYFERRPEATARRLNAPAPVDLAIADVIPRGDLAMQAMAAPFALPGRSEAAVAIVVGLRHDVPADALEQRVELVTGAFDHDGRQRGVQHLSARLRLRRAEQGAANYELLTRIDLKPGRYSLRIGAHNTVIDKSGSVFINVDVPDFSRERLSLSGLLLTASSSPMAAPTDALHGVLPIAPSTLRHFDAQDRVSVFVRVYQGGKESLQTVAMGVRLTDAEGRTVTSSTESIPGERFAPARAFDYSVPMVVSSLAPGAYLLEVEARASISEPGRRQIRFHMR